MNLSALLRTNRPSLDLVLLILRVALGVVMFPHGAQKMLGLFGGPGFAQTMQFFAQMHIPPLLGVLACLAEFVGSMLVLVGFLTRLAALAITTNMLVAVATVHYANGFFMNWGGDQKGEGIEYFIFAVAIGLTLVIAGAGRFSIDARLAGEGATPSIRIAR